MERLLVERCDVAPVEKRQRGKQRTKAYLRIACPALVALLMGACTSLKLPERLYPVSEEIADLKNALGDPSAALEMSAKLSKKEAKKFRNNVITARKYAIDVQYTTYEAALTHEAQELDFGAKTASIALATTANLIPVGHTSTMLSGIGTGVTQLDDAYNEKVLRAQIIQNIQASMRTARHDQAAVIFGNMNCSIKAYPMAMALSDLESYYRAGTAPAGLIKLTQTVTKAESDAKATEDVQKPSSPDANAKLAANATEAAVKATSAATKKPKCKVDTSAD